MRTGSVRTGGALSATVFRDRDDAGVQLAERLLHLKRERPVVLGLPRGGMPVAARVAAQLEAPCDVMVVRKLGAPGHPEFAFGAVGEDDTRFIDDLVTMGLGLPEATVESIVRREQREVERRVAEYRGHLLPVMLQGRTVVVVDDGWATGSTAMAALRIARSRGARRVVAAAPIAPRETIERLRHEADEVVVVDSPEHFISVGQWYDDFSQVSESQVADILQEVDTEDFHEPIQGSRTDRNAVIPVGGISLYGSLRIPTMCEGIVVFAHGSGSSRHSPRNQAMAQAFNKAGLGTLLFDLLTTYEARERQRVFDVELLGTRLSAVTHWLRRQPEARGLPIGYLGASTGAAAALWAAAEPGSPVQAVVSRGGRPDLAGKRLIDVRAATLMLVGGDDELVLDLNRRAAAFLNCEHRIEVIAGAGHLFDEPGTMEQVSTRAIEWFDQHLRWPETVQHDTA